MAGGSLPHAAYDTEKAMKIILKIVLLGVSVYYAQHVLPWWSVSVVTLVAFFVFPSRLFVSFLSGFFTIGALWFWLSWRVHMQTDGVLSKKVAELFRLPDPVYLVLLTGLVGGLVGSISALVGSRLRSLLTKRRGRSFF